MDAMKQRDVKVGMLVRYHPIVGGRHDQNLYRVRDIGAIAGIPVAWLDGKSGCVSVDALSLPQPGADNYGLGHDG